MYKELNGCIIGEFSKLKLLQAPKFDEMRKMFAAELTRMFVVPANTFDNVKGEFPIGFKVWRTERKHGATVGGDLRAPRCEDGAPGGRALPDWPFADVYDRDGRYDGTKGVHLYDGEKVINDWVATFGNNDKQPKSHGTLLAIANDFQNQGTVRICEPNKPWNHQFQWQVMPSNVLQSSIYFAVRLCIEATWLNDRDQFLYPNDGWKSDGEFQGDCLVFTLFHGQNRISAEQGVNHWIPFTEEVGAQDCFASHFMSDFLKGKVDGGVIDTALPGFGDGRAVSMKPPRQMELRTVFAAGESVCKHGAKFTISSEAKSEVFVVTDQFFGVGFSLDEDDVARREEEDSWEPLVVFYELDETAQASRIRSLVQKLVAKGAALAHEIGSDTYAGWRDLLCFVEDYTPPLVHHLTENDRKECYGELEAILQLHKRLRIDLNVFGKAGTYKSELGSWAAAWVSDYNVKAGFVELCRGRQRSFRIAPSSKKAWEILTALFTSDDPEGWTKLPTGWKSQFVRRIGSSGELDRDSDIVKIAAMIVPHTPRKGRGGDGLYRFGFARPPKAK